MNYPTATGEPIRHKPAHYGDDLAAPTYLLSVSSLRARAAFRGDLAREGLRYPTDTELLAELRRAIGRHLVDSDAAPALEAVDAVEAGIADDAATALAQLVDHACARHDRTYAHMLSERVEYLATLPLVAARRFLVAVQHAEREPQVLRRSFGLVSDDDLAAIPQADLTDIGLAIVAAMAPDEATKKN
jgi:hypothetical protein